MSLTFSEAVTLLSKPSGHAITHLNARYLTIFIFHHRSADLSTGVIQFSSVEKADRAYTLFNGATIKDSNCHLQLRVHSSGTYGEPEVTSGILSIYNLPLNTNNHLLYDMFRPFGPMALCKIIMDQGQFKGTALVQYFRSADADAAGAEMASIS